MSGLNGYVGKAVLRGQYWFVEAEPDIAIRLKRIFKRSDHGAAGRIMFSNTPESCADLAWACQRWPLEIEPAAALAAGAARHHEAVRRLQDFLSGTYEPRPFEMALPPRSYQAREAEIALAQGHLLVADEVGLGKTWTGAAVISDPRARPAVVVTLTHLPRQWTRELIRAMPHLQVHILKSTKLYPLPTFLGNLPDVVVTSYSKLAAWSQVLGAFAKSVVFDEIQELRRDGTQKYEGAKALVAKASFRLGLSATPIYNYGDEIRSVLEILKPGALGTKREFDLEWGKPAPGGKIAIRDPRAFGAWARRSGLMIRHTREEVGRELPPVTVIRQTIGSDARELAKIEGSAADLARIILSGTAGQRGDVMQASEQLSNMLRQATGIAKAPYVAEFVRILVDSGEKVVLYGWHRSVYDLWEERLAGLRVAKYTGGETALEKDRVAVRFKAGELDVLLISLRSGAGLEGLQEAASVVVFGELDWSPGVHEQCIGRIWRDGQARKVIAYYLVAEDGSDPTVAEVLGLKREQVEGIRDPQRTLVERLETDPDRVRKLAQAFLARAGHQAPPPTTD